MINIPAQAISFNLYYGGKSTMETMGEGDPQGEPALQPVSEETPQFKNIFIRDVNCKGAYQGIFLQGLPEMNLENIQLENIQMEADYGLICTDVTKIKIKDLKLVTKKMPVLDFRNSRNVSVDGLIVLSDANQVIRLSGSKTENVILKNSGIKDERKQVMIGKEVPAKAFRLDH